MSFATTLSYFKTIVKLTAKKISSQKHESLDHLPKLIGQHGYRLQRSSITSRLTTQTFNYDKKNELTINIIDRFVISLLRYYLTLSFHFDFNSFERRLLITDPIFKHSINKVTIIFFYFSPFNYKPNSKFESTFTSLTNILINGLINEDYFGIMGWLESCYQKEVKFQLIKLQRPLYSAQIYSQFLSFAVETKYKTFSTSYRYKINKAFPNVNTLSRAKFISKLMAWVRQEVIDQNNRNIINFGSTFTYSNFKFNTALSTNRLLLIQPLLPFKLMLGLTLNIKGRIIKTISRSQKLRLIKGPFTTPKVTQIKFILR